MVRGALPAVFTVAMGALVGAVSTDGALGGPLVAVGIVFVTLQVLAPLHAQVDPSSRIGPRRG